LDRTCVIPAMPTWGIAQSVQLELINLIVKFGILIALFVLVVHTLEQALQVAAFVLVVITQIRVRRHAVHAQPGAFRIPAPHIVRLVLLGNILRRQLVLAQVARPVHMPQQQALPLAHLVQQELTL